MLEIKSHFLDFSNNIAGGVRSFVSQIAEFFDTKPKIFKNKGVETEDGSPRQGSDSVPPTQEISVPLTVGPVPTTVEPVPTTVSTVEPVPMTVEPVPMTVEPMPSAVEDVFSTLRLNTIKEHESDSDTKELD